MTPKPKFSFKLNVHTCPQNVALYNHTHIHTHSITPVFLGARAISLKRLPVKFGVVKPGEFVFLELWNCDAAITASQLHSHSCCMPATVGKGV